MRFPQLGLVVILAAFSTGCGGKGELEAGIPEGAFGKPAPPLSEAQLKMKEKIEKQGGVAPVSSGGTPGGGQSYIDKMKNQYGSGKK